MDTRLIELQWLAKQRLPMWGGHLERSEPISDLDGMSGSPGEWIVERMDELETGDQQAAQGRHFYLRIVRAMQVFVVINKGRKPGEGAVYVFDNHDAALRCREDLNLTHWNLWGCSISREWKDGAPVRACEQSASKED